MTDADKKALVLVLRSLINSRKDDSNITNLCNDYRDTEGRDIPFQQFKYRNLGAFLSSTGEFSVFPNQTIVAKAAETSEHINKLVSEQNSSKKRRPQRMMAPQRHIHSSHSMPQSFYSSGYQQMKYRSPVKHPKYQQLPQNGYANSGPKYYQKHNNNVPPVKPSRVAQLPPHSNRPMFVHTFDAGMQPANALARAAVQAKSAVPSVAPTVVSQKQPTSSQTMQGAEAVSTTQAKDLRQVIQERYRNAQEAQQPIAAFKDSRQVLQESNRPVQVPFQKGVQATLQITINNHIQQQIPTRGPSKLHDRLKQNPPIEAPAPTAPTSNVTSQSAVNEFGVTSKLSSRLQRFKSVPSQDTISDGTSPTPNSVSPSSSSSSGRSLTTHVGDANNIIQELANFCAKKMYAQPEYKIFAIQTTSRVKGNVKVNGTTYSTYPHDYETSQKAKLEAARCALEQLKLATEQPVFEVCMDPDSEVSMKLYDLLKGSSYGVFRRNIPDMFQKAYQLSLPEHWFQIVLRSPQLFTMSESVQGNQIVSVLTEATEIVDRITSKKIVSNELFPFNIIPSSPTATDSPIINENVNDVSNFKYMDKLQLPWSEKHWNLYVTNPKSSVEIWGRLIGPEYSDKIDSLMTDIELDLMLERKRPETLQVGNIYIVIVSECTYRVRIDRNMLVEKQSLCFLIDVGDEEWFNMDEIYECKEQFLKFPAQAICLSLFGLEDFAENPSAKEHLDNMLTHKALIGEVLSNQDEYEAQLASEDQAAKVRVGLYDTSSDEDVHLNNVILTMICDSYVAPALQPVGYTNAVISHVDDEAAVYCQLRSSSGGLQYVQKLIHHIVHYDFNQDQHRICSSEIVAKENTPQKPVYLVKDNETAKWYRATVLDQNGSDYRMFYVDFGMTRLVNGTNIFRLDSLSAALNRYPYQAIKCRLHDINEKPTASVLASLRGYLNDNTPAVLKVMSMRTVVPVVKIYIRVNNGPLFCINDSIQLEQEIASSPDIVEDLVSSPFFASNSSDIINGNSAKKPSPLKPVEPVGLTKCLAPAAGEWFDLQVTLASNPLNFMVRRSSLLKDFQSMMIEMQQYCKASTGYVAESEIQLGEAYACLQNDGIWYRVVVEQLLGGNVFQLFSCDYGDLAVVHGSEQLKVLPVAYRTLPQLAMSAKLYGIQPKNQDWETDDCLHFQRLTVEKQFAAQVHVATAFSDGSVMLELTLIDVSNITDININGLLLDDERAISVY